MKKFISAILIINICFFNLLPCCAKPFKSYTQLEIREMQTHIYDTQNKQEVFKAAINTLQDNGFIILNIEDEMGYIRAKKDFRKKYTDKSRIAGYSLLLAYYITMTVFSYGAAAYTIADPINRMGNELSKKTFIVDSNVNIEPYGNKTRVRCTMVEKILENADGYSYIKSSPRKVIRIYEPVIYQAFFNELDKNIFYGRI
ncbi:MAG: hypothetical protein KHX03_04415 [Clostridium sp.]|nr:hypothetical protein [Clostridium sp.]